MAKMDPVVHFEMPAKNRKRVVAFYEAAFGWKSEQMGPEMGNYVVVQTGETDKKRMLKKPGMINGGFFEYSANNPNLQHPSIVIAVENIKQGMKRVEKAGGKIIGGEKPGKPDDIPGVGLYIAFKDSEGNRVGMLEPKIG